MLQTSPTPTPTRGWWRVFPSHGQRESWKWTNGYDVWAAGGRSCSDRCHYSTQQSKVIYGLWFHARQASRRILVETEHWIPKHHLFCCFCFCFCFCWEDCHYSVWVNLLSNKTFYFNCLNGITCNIPNHVHCHVSKSFFLWHLVSLSGHIVNSEIRSFMKKQPEVMTIYRSITTTLNKTISLTGSHLIYARQTTSGKFNPMWVWYCFADHTSFYERIV